MSSGFLRQRSSEVAFSNRRYPDSLDHLQKKLHTGSHVSQYEGDKIMLMEKDFTIITNICVNDVLLSILYLYGIYSFTFNY